MAVSSVHIIITDRVRTVEYVAPNLYRIKECGTYMSCTGIWPKETTNVSYDTLCRLLKVEFFVMI